MESFVVIVAAAFLLFIVMVIWAISRIATLRGTQDKVQQLEHEVNRLGRHLASLETHIAQTAAKAPPREEPAPKPAPSTETVAPISPPPPRRTITPPLSAPIAPQRPTPPAPVRVLQPQPVRLETPTAEPIPSPKRSISLEERLGQNWLNKLGIVTLVTGLALLLGYQLRTLGPLGKSIMGILLSVAILATGLLLERRERYRIFARAAIGGGWALLFFVTFALFHIPAMQVLHSQAIDLVLMLTVATAMVLHSLRYRSQVVTSLAFLLGFFTVAISHVTVFSLVAGAILAAGLVAVAFRERWFVMVLGGLTAVYLTHFIWLQRVLPDGAQPGHTFPQFFPSAALLLFYWLLFRAFYILRIPDNERDGACATINVLLNSAGLLTLLKYQSSHPEWAFYGLLALGAAELVMAFLARRRHHDAFVTLSCIGSLFLLASIPFHFAGASWSLAWLLEAEMLFITGLALRETVFRRLGLLSAFAAIGQLFVQCAAPIFEARQLAPDANHHAALAMVFGCAAFVTWFNAEYAVRRWPSVSQHNIDRNTLRVLSYLATLCAAVALWLPLAGAWTILSWLALTLSLALVADRLRSSDLAQQSELLGLAALARMAIINFAQWSHFSHTTDTLILLSSSALLYLHMRRRQPSHLVQLSQIEAVYAWPATALLATLAWYALQPAAIGIAWCVLGVTLLELGLATRKAFFRQQGFVLLTASFVRLFFINIALAPAPRAYTMLPLAAIFAYVYHRMYSREQQNPTDRMAGAANAWFALTTVATLLYVSLRPEWVSIGGALLAVTLLALARMLRRPLFTAQAITMILLTAARTLAFNIISAEPLSAHGTEGRIFTVGITCALLFAALPIAFSLRKQQAEASTEQPAWMQPMHHPEQLFFFAPLTLLFAWIPMQLRAGMITVGWSTLGLLTFLVALAVKERSFRLAGLGVLLVGLGKIVVIDIWNAAPMDRYITLIVMGAALLLVSFLYSRYRETILELL